MMASTSERQINAWIRCWSVFKGMMMVLQDAPPVAGPELTAILLRAPQLVLRGDEHSAVRVISTQTRLLDTPLHCLTWNFGSINSCNGWPCLNSA